MQKITVKSLFLCALLALSLPQAGFAATPADAVLLEEVPPPPNAADDGSPDASVTEEPQVTIRKKGKDTVEEYRINGELYMMKVTPDHGVPYYLHKEDSNGDWVNDGPTKPLSVPKWIIFRF